MSIDSLLVPVENLTAHCDAGSLGFETTEEVAPLAGTVGQDRAISALDFGLTIDGPGYNIYVVGFPGTGRTTTLSGFLERAAQDRPVPDDWCYVYNFRNPQQPIAVCVPAGTGRALVNDMDELLAECLREIPGAFESDDYRARMEEALRETYQRREAISKRIEQEAQEQGFVVQPSQAGIMTTPVKDGQPLGREQYNQLPEEEKTQLREKSEQLQDFINRQMVELRRIEREAYHVRAEVDRNLVLRVMAPAFLELRDKYADTPELLEYLDAVKEDIAEHVEEFRVPQEQREQQLQQQYPGEPRFVLESMQTDRFVRYKVNVLVDNSATHGAPVIFEYNPTYYNLFGRIDYRPRFGTFSTHLTMIQPGAIHRANGGYLAMQAKDLLVNPLSWDTLKRVLRSGETRVENIGEQYSAVPTSTMRPQPIPINTKIVLVGTPYLFNLLQYADEDFRKLFKVRADFDVSMDNTSHNSKFYAAFVCNRCHDVSVKHFHKTAVARLIEYASRIVEDQSKLTTRFIDIADVITEADYWSQRDGNSPVVMGEHVEKAIAEKMYRSNLPEERLQELIHDGTILIDTAGATVGQVNGMSVLSLGDYAFGRPVRITATTALGRGQVVNVDREAQMTGKIHNKGFFILTSFLSGKYGQDKPLSIHGSIGFEQTYDEVEGDSASAAELYALLSSVADVPIKQSFAVTGSVNQFGQVQAIGGATFKIEGFFDVCKAKGLTGEQGVIIPRANVRNLVLRRDVVEAVEAGHFKVYAVETIDEGLEILTGVPVGQKDEQGNYPDGTLNSMINAKLEQFSEKARQLARHQGPGEQTGTDDHDGSGEHAS